MSGENRGTMPWRHGAYAALRGQDRADPYEGTAPVSMVGVWFDGFDEARRRLALLEGELVRGEDGS